MSTKNILKISLICSCFLGILALGSGNVSAKTKEVTVEGTRVKYIKQDIDGKEQVIGCNLKGCSMHSKKKKYGDKGCKSGSDLRNIHVEITNKKKTSWKTLEDLKFTSMQGGCIEGDKMYLSFSDKGKNKKGDLTALVIINLKESKVMKVVLIKGAAELNIDTLGHSNDLTILNNNIHVSWYQEEGKKYYEAIVRDKTGSDMSAEEVIEYIDDKITALYLDLYQLMTSNPDIYDKYEKFDISITDPDEIMDFIISKMGDDYPAPVTTEHNMEYLDKSSETEGVLAYYITPPVDNININNIKINGSALADDAVQTYTSIAHEGIPGHMLQYTSFYDNADISNVRKLASIIGPSEGWAQYASFNSLEYIVEEEGYDKDVAEIIAIDQRLGYLIQARFDLGVNYEDWDLEDAGNYSGGMYDEEIVKVLYDAVTEDPGMIIPYAYGTEYMYDLRDEYFDKKGKDVKGFNTFIINSGVLPFPLYEEYMKEYLD